MTDHAKVSVFKRAFLSATQPVERGFDSIKTRLGDRFDRDDPIQILPFRGFGTPQRLFIQGRVLQDEPVNASGENDTVLQNVGNMWKRFESDEVPHARLVARFPGWEQELTADEEGYFRAEIELASPSVPVDLWHQVELELVHPEPGVRGIRASAPVLVPPSDSEFGVISDIDDTVLETELTNPWRRFLQLIYSKQRMRLPFDGIAALYQAMAEPHNPIFYVSNAPWNLYQHVVELLDHHGIPKGPVLLRDSRIAERVVRDEASGQVLVHKQRALRRIVEEHPNLSFVMLGDSSRRDPLRYVEIAEAYPGRVAAIYIRRVHGVLARRGSLERLQQRAERAGVELLVADDTVTIAKHAQSRGFVLPSDVGQVREGKARDELAPPIELNAASATTNGSSG